VNVYTTSVGTLAGNLVVGKTYIIRSLGTTDFTLVGAAQNKVGISFVATGVGSGSGVVSESYSWNLSTSTNNNYTGYFVYNNLPFAISSTTANNGRYLDVGSIVKFVAPPGYYFNSTNNLIAGTPTRTSDIKEIFATILNVRDSGTNSGLGNYSNGVGPVVLNNLVPTGALIEYIIPSFKNNLNLFFVNSLVSKLSQNLNVGIFFNNTTQNWEIVNSDNISTNSPHNWFVKFEYNNALSQYVVSYRGIEFVFHSPSENVFYFDEDVKIYDSKNAKTIKDNIKVLKINNDPNLNTRLGNDLNWDIYKKYLETDGYTNNTKIYITYSDSDQDGVPDDPRSFELLVNPQSSDPSKYIFFKSSTVQLGVNRYVELLLVPKGEIIVEYPTKVDMLANAASLRVGQVLYATNENLFYSVVSGGNGASNTISQNPLTNYQSYIGRQDLYYQYKHNSPNTRRINPSLSNIIDIYILTSNYDLSYREWITDSSNKITEPTPPTTNELELEFQSLNNFKTISDSLLMQTATYKPLFGNKADNNLQATFKIVKNPNVNVSDSDVKTSVISAINTYFQIENWDFGETFYFSELSAYLHRVLSPNIASIVIVPKDPNIKYGVLHQINAEPYEILISAATVDDVEIISAVTANQLNQGII
jgi:hypothetical protein